MYFGGHLLQLERWIKSITMWKIQFILLKLAQFYCIQLTVDIIPQMTWWIILETPNLFYFAANIQTFSVRTCMRMIVKHWNRLIGVEMSMLMLSHMFVSVTRLLALLLFFVHLSKCFSSWGVNNKRYHQNTIQREYAYSENLSPKFRHINAKKIWFHHQSLVCSAIGI